MAQTIIQILGTVGSGAFVFWYLVHYKRRPRLEVWYDAKLTKEWRGIPGRSASLPSGSLSSTRPSLIQSTLVGASPAPSRLCWYHVQVKNTGPKPARSVRGYILQLLEEQEDGEFRAHPKWGGRLTLQWANTNGKEEIQVARRRKPWDRLDILHVGDAPGYFHLVTPTPLVGLPTGLSDGVYRLLVRVESETTSAQCALEIALAKTWDEVSVRQIPLDLVGESAGI